MKLMIAATMVMFAVAALTTTEASARVPVSAHHCMIHHKSPWGGPGYWTRGLCR